MLEVYSVWGSDFLQPLDWKHCKTFWSDAVPQNRPRSFGEANYPHVISADELWEEPGDTFWVAEILWKPFSAAPRSLTRLSIIRHSAVNTFPMNMQWPLLTAWLQGPKPLTHPQVDGEFHPPKKQRNQTETTESAVNHVLCLLSS